MLAHVVDILSLVMQPVYSTKHSTSRLMCSILCPISVLFRYGAGNAMVEKLYLGFTETLPGRGASARVGGSVETARTEAQQNRKQANDWHARTHARQRYSTAALAVFFTGEPCARGRAPESKNATATATATAGRRCVSCYKSSASFGLLGVYGAVRVLCVCCYVCVLLLVCV